MLDRFTDNAKKVMLQARHAALQLGHEHIAPEHILLGMLQHRDCTAAKLLAQLGIDPEGLRAALLAVTPRGRGNPDLVQLPFTPEAKRVLECTLEEASRLCHAWMGSQHLLLGLACAEQGAPAQVLQKLGADVEKLRAAVQQTIPTSHRARVRALLISNSTMHGGGYLEHCAQEIRDFLGPEKKKVLFVPYALADHDAYAAKAQQAFAPLGHEIVSVHTREHHRAAALVADAVFIGGGNTFRLLASLYHYDLLAPIARRVFDGMPYVGSSAGTNVAALTIRTTNDMPIVQPPSFTALQLVPFQINPHYLDPDPASRHMGETREERIRQFHEEHDVPVLGMREGCVMRVEGTRAELRGTTNARLFRRGQTPEELTPVCDLSFLLKE